MADAGHIDTIESGGGDEEEERGILLKRWTIPLEDREGTRDFEKMQGGEGEAGDFGKMNGGEEEAGGFEKMQGREGEAGEFEKMQGEKEEDEIGYEFGLIERFAMPVSCALGYFEEEDVAFDLTCVVCWQASGPSSVSCADGHAICDACYKRRIKKCPAEIIAGSSRQFCEAALFGIDEAIMNTPYYKYFMNEAIFRCGSCPLGCLQICSGKDVEDHELNECAYRVIRFCGFQSLGCSAIFKSLQSNVRHLIKKHEVPVSLDGQGRFLVRYDRKEFLEEKAGEADKIVPMIRAVLAGPDNVMCLILAKDLKDMTRLWVASCGRLQEDCELKAHICICPSTAKLESFQEPKDELVYEEVLKVNPAVQTMLDVESMGGFVDLSNGYLDSIQVNQGEKRYFTLLIVIRKYKQDSSKDAAEEVADLDSVDGEELKLTDADEYRVRGKRNYSVLNDEEEEEELEEYRMGTQF